MKLKLTLVLVAFTPTMVMAQAPVVAPPEIVKEPVITRPGEGVSGVYKPKEPAEVNTMPAQQAHEGSKHIIIRNVQEAQKEGLQW
jgi:hypothetical protein